MPAALNRRIVMSLLLWLMLAPLTDLRSADAGKSWATPAQARERIPRREPRPLWRRAIFQAIQNDLAKKGISEHGGLRPGDLKIQSSLPVFSDEMGLQVKRIGFDTMRREIVFELWASHEPQFLPFKVTTRRDPRSWGLTPPPEWNLGDLGGEPRTGSPATGQQVSRAGSKSPVLAKPGRPATLVMLGQNVRITTTVVPLQPGSKGQCILVRDLATARVMTAEVVDEGLLRTSF